MSLNGSDDDQRASGSADSASRDGVSSPHPEQEAQRLPVASRSRGRRASDLIGVSDPLDPRLRSGSDDDANPGGMRRLGLEAPWIMLAALLGATLLSAWQSQQKANLAAQERFNELATQAVSEFQSYANRNVSVLRSVAALASVDPELDDTTLSDFVETTERDVYADLGITAVQILPASPDSGRDPSTKPPLVYRPSDAQIDLADLGKSPRLQSAIAIAGTRREVAIVGKLSSNPGGPLYTAVVVPVLQRDSRTAPPSGFVIGYLALGHQPERRGPANRDLLRVSLFENGELIYAGPQTQNGVGASAPQFLSDLPLRFANARWTLRAASAPRLEAELRDTTPTTIAALGTIGTLLLVGMVWLLTRLREQASNLASTMTRQLRDQAKFTEDLIEFNPNPIFRKDRSGRYVAINKAMEAFTGRSRNELLGKRDRDFERLQDAAIAEEHDESLLDTAEGFATREVVMTDASGNERQVIVAKQILRKSDGAPDGLIGTLTDITQVKLLEKEVERQREQLTLVINASQQGIWDVNLTDPRQNYFSDRFCEIVGYPPARFPTVANWRDHIHPHDVSRFGERVIEHFKGVTPLFDIEIRARRADGTYTWVRVRAAAQRNASGRAVRFVGSIVDVTDRKEAELRLVEANERTLEAARAKEAFLATMSHEIRTPLNGVLGMAGLLAETPLNEEQRDYIRLIRASGDTLLRLTNDVLDFSKIESGRMVLESVPVEVIALVEEAFELVADKARGRPIDLIRNFDDSVPNYILADPTRLRQILLNLLSNAIKFTERGEVRCELTARHLHDGKLELIGVVSDTGIGIPADRLSNLFQAFTQVDASTTRKYGGTGLGLAIVKRLCEAMGGGASAESSPGRGSRFSFKIITQETRGAPRPYMQTNIAEFVGKSVLYIDRNTTRRNQIISVFSKWGLNTRAVTWDEAPSLLASANFDVIFSDSVEESPATIAIQRALIEHDARCRAESRPIPAVVLVSSTTRAELAEARTIPKLRHDFFALRPIGRAKLFEILQRSVSRDFGADVSLRPFTETPVHDATYVPPRPVVPQQEPHSKALNPAMRMRILVAEDNEINQRVISGMLAGYGHSVTMVGNGREAVDASSRGIFDLILMDIHMPVMDGVAATHAILASRSAAMTSPCPIVAMTANALQGDREYYLSTGMSDYISKPLRKDELSALLNRINAKRMGMSPTEVQVPEVASPTHTSTNAEDNTLSKIDLLDVEQLNDMVDLPSLAEDGVTREALDTSLIDLYKEKTRERIAKIQDALIDAKWKDLSEVAHSMRGASASIGLPRVAGACKDIELLSRKLAEENDTSPSHPKLDDMYEALTACYAESIGALDRWLADRASGKAN